jgi:hypothetical protein
LKADRIEKVGDVDDLVLGERDEPVPRPNEVLVRVRATSLNRRDLMILARTYPLPSKPGVVSISDGAGEVVAVGESVRRARVGDRLVGTYFVRWLEGRLTLELVAQYGCSVDGMLAEYALLHEDSVVHVPAHLSFEEAATLPCAAVTAWSALTGPRPVVAEETVLTLGTGGVALFAVRGRAHRLPVAPQAALTPVADLADVPRQPYLRPRLDRLLHRSHCSPARPVRPGHTRPSPPPRPPFQRDRASYRCLDGPADGERLPGRDRAGLSPP